MAAVLGEELLDRPQKGPGWLIALAIALARVIVLADTLRRSEGKFEGVERGVGIRETIRK